MRGRWNWGSGVFAVGVAAFIFAAIVPLTGWLTRLQTEALFRTPEPWRFVEADTEWRFAARERLALQRKPDDFELHLASALRAPYSYSTEETILPAESGLPEDGVARKLRSLEALRGRWGENPALMAAVLRTMTSSLVTPNRDYLENLTSRYQNAQASRSDAPTKIRDDRRVGRNSPTNLALFQENAERGERADPENAYFTAMLAVSLFAERRDSEAQDALRRAAAAQRWEDCSIFEMRGTLALSEAVYGRRGVITQLAQGASVTYPQFATMRSLARTAIGKAIERERAGDSPTGFDLRRSVARIGALMQEKRGSYVGSQTGSAVVSAASIFPGGVIAVKPPNLTPEQWTARREQDYGDYLSRIGHADEAVWYERQQQEGRAQEELRRKASGKAVWEFPRLKATLPGYALGWAAMLNAFWMIVFGGLAALALRRPWGVRPKPVALPIRLGVGWVFVLLASLIVCGVADAFFSISATANGTTLLLGGMMAFALLALGFCAFRLWRSVRLEEGASSVGRFWRDFGRFSFSAVATAALIFVVLWPVSQLFTLANIIYYSYFMADIPFYGGNAQGFGAFVLAILVSLLAPLGVSLYGVGFGLYRREAIVSSVARILRKTALPAAGVLLLLYAPIVAATALQDNHLRAELQRGMEHERQYLLKIALNADDASKKRVVLVGEAITPPRRFFALLG